MEGPCWTSWEGKDRKEEFVTQAQRTRESSQVPENAKAQEHNAVRNVRIREMGLYGPA